MFEISTTPSFNTDKLVYGDEYDYVTRTSFNQGVLRKTGYVNQENINEKGTWSLGLLQMDFFYRKNPWYAGQFVRKIVPKISLGHNSTLYFTAILNKQKQKLLSVLVRDVDSTFLNGTIYLPTKNGEIDFEFMDAYISELEEERISELEEERISELSAYLTVSRLDNYELSSEEKEALESYNDIMFDEYKFKDIFNNIKQGRRLKKDDQIIGTIPFVMSGITNTGVVGYISNPVALFSKNSITIDIFGNSFYRNYDFGAGDDTGVYWSDKVQYSKGTMLYFTAAMEKSLSGKYSYGKKLRSSQSYNFKIQLPTKNNEIDFSYMELLISAVQKLVIKDVVMWKDKKIEATKQLVGRN